MYSGNSTSPTPAATAKKTRKNPTSLPTVATSTRSLVPWSLRRRKKSVETPTTNMARVASMNGAPSIAPIPISAPSSDASPVRTGSRMATMAIMLSGKAVPTAARRLPTAPWRSPRRPPSISIAFVKKAAPRRIATSATTNSITVDKTHLLSDGPRDTKKRAIAACLPADGLALCALAPVTGREPRSVMTTGPPATAGGYSPTSYDLTRSVLLVGEGLHLGRQDECRRIQRAGRRLLLSRCTRGSERDNVASVGNVERSESESETCDPGRGPRSRRRGGPDAGLRPPGSRPARRHDRRRQRPHREDHAQHPAGALPRRVYGRACGRWRF